jgi:D-inositol-3-phosphate glycosyltransferase
MTRVAIIDPLGKHGGHHYYVDGTAEGITASGHEVTVYLTKFTGLNGSSSYRQVVAFGELYGSSPFVIRAARYVKGLVLAQVRARAWGAKIVYLHAFNHDLRELLAVWGCRFLGMPVAVTVHDVEAFGTGYAGLIRYLTMKGASILIFQNNFSRIEYEKRESTSEKRVVIIPHGNYCLAYPGPPSKEASRIKLQLESTDFILLFFGNPRKEKGLDILLIALAKLRDYKTIKLLIAGKMGSSQLVEVRTQIRSLDLDERVRIDARHIDDNEAQYYYRASDVVVIPYRKIYESGVTIMAMSLGCPVIVADHEPLVEKVEEGVTGFIFENESPESLAASLRMAYEKRTILSHMGEEGLRRVRAQRDWMKIGALHAQVIKDEL